MLIYAFACHHWSSQAILLKKDWEFQNAALPIEDRLGLIELAPNVGIVPLALANLQVRPTLCVAARLVESSRRQLKTTWPDAFLLQDDQEIDESACQHWAAYGLHIAKWLMTGTITSAAGDPEISRVAQMMQVIAPQTTARILV